jgi:energy-converting hydrogenase Eha subunit C
MHAEQLWGIVRTILAAIGGWIAAKGYVDDATIQAVIGAIGTIFVAVWSFVAKKPATPPPP